VSDETCEVVFVYGTLRRGGSNHWRMSQAKFIGDAFARGRLYRIDWYPGFVADDNAGQVKGEVFMADAETIKHLDAFEGSEYRRVKIAVESADGGSIDEAWIWEWMGEVDETRRIASGDWLSVS